MVTPDFIEKLKQVLQTSGVPQADVSYVVASWVDLSRPKCLRFKMRINIKNIVDAGTH